MNFEPPPLSFALKICAHLVGACPELLRRAPPRDRSSVAMMALLMASAWIWQTLAFSLTAHILVDESSRIRLELVAIAALLATIVMLIDGQTLIKSASYMHGLAQLRQGGLEIPGYLGLRIRNGFQYLFRLPLAIVFAQLASIGVMLYGFAPEIMHRLQLSATTANLPLQTRVATVYDASSGRIVAEIEQLRSARAKAQTDAGAFRLDALQTPAEDPELKPAIALVRRAEEAKLDADRRLARVSVRDELARRSAAQRVAARKIDLQKAQERVDALREQAQSAAEQRRGAIEGRLGETQAAEQRYATRIDALEQAHAARVAAREDSIRAAMERDPDYRTPDRGLLARTRVLGQLMEDSWVFTVATLLHLGLFGIELAAVLTKALTCVPTAYGVMLAGEEYAHNVETAHAVFARISDPGAEAAPAEAVQAPVTFDADDDRFTARPAVPDLPANDDAAPDETGSTAERLQVGAEAAKAQAAARARAAKAKAAKASKTAEPEADDLARQPADPEETPVPALPRTEAPTLAETILDGPVRRGRGRPPGAKNKATPANDDGPDDLSVVA